MKEKLENAKKRIKDSMSHFSSEISKSVETFKARTEKAKETIQGSKLSLCYDRAGSACLSFLYRHIHIIAILVITAIALTVRYLFAEYETNDLTGFVLPWMNGIKKVGFSNFYKVNADYSTFYLFIIGILTLFPDSPRTISNGYPVSWIYEVKTIYFISDILLALAVYLILKELKQSKTICTIGYTVAVVLPVQILNSSVWGNCDTLYTVTALFSLYFLLRGKDFTSMFFVGLGLIIKLNGIFIIPFYVLMLLYRKAHLLSVLMIPLAVLISFLPAYICGAGFKEPFSYILDQTSGYKDLTLGCANFWHIFGFGNLDIINRGSTLLGLSLIGLFMVLIVLLRVKMDQRGMVATFVFLAGVTVFFLPHMHERYFYILDVGVLIYALVMKKRYWFIVGMQVSSGIAYYHYLSGKYFIESMEEDSVTIAAVINLIILAVMFYDLVKYDKGPTFHDTIESLTKNHSESKEENRKLESESKAEEPEAAPAPVSEGEPPVQEESAQSNL